MALITYQISIDTDKKRATPGDASQSNYKALITPSVDAQVGGKIWGEGGPYPADWPEGGQFENSNYGYLVEAGDTLALELQPTEEVWIRTESGSGTANILLSNVETPATADGIAFAG